MKENKKISVRKHLPLFVRVHYDIVRNFSLAKLAGLSVIAVAGFFGLLLATQTISPSSFASSNEVDVIQAIKGVTVAKVSEVRVGPPMHGGKSLKFNVNVAIGNLGDITPVKYYMSDSSNHECSTDKSSYTQTAVAGSNTNNDVGGAFTADFNTSRKTICVSVKTFTSGTPPRRQHVVHQGYYSIPVNQSETATNSGTSQQARSTTGQLTEIASFTVPKNSVKAMFTVNFKDSSNPRLIDGVKYYNKLVQSPTCSESPRLYKTSSSKTNRRVSGADQYIIDLGLKTQQVCIMVSLSDRVSTKQYHAPLTIPLNITSITPNNSGNLIATANRRNVTWRNFGPNNLNEICNAGIFNVPPTDRDRIRSSNTAVVSSGDNGKYYCFEARHGGDVAYRSARVSNSRGAVTAEEDITIDLFKHNEDNTVTFVVIARNNSTINSVKYQTSSESTNRTCSQQLGDYNSSAEKRETVYGPMYVGSSINTAHNSICILVSYTKDTVRYVKIDEPRALTPQTQQQVTPTPVTPTPPDTTAPVTPTPPDTTAPVTPTPGTTTSPVTTCEAGKTLNTEGACVDNQGEEVTSAPKTGILDDDNNWSLVGYVLLAVAVLGAARILIVKKYKQIS